MKILLLESDKHTIEVLVAALLQLNLVIDVVSDGLLGWEHVKAVEYSLILSAIELPGLDGMSLCRKLRQENYWMPMLLLTSEDQNSMIQAFDAGADDYLTQPFDLNELVVRVRALLRRSRPSGTQILQWGSIRLDPTCCEATYKDQLLDLTPTEFNLLKLFLRNRRRVLSRSMIVDQLWTSEDPPAEDTIKSHIKSLRQKFKLVGGSPNLIETVYGLGYRLKPLVEPSNKQLISSNFKQLNRTDKARAIVMSQDIEILDMLPTLLQPQGIDLFAPENHQKFYEYLENFWPEIAILDLEASAQESVALCQKIRNTQPWTGMSILFLVTDTSPRTLAQIFAVGADDYLSKPIVEPEFVNRVTKHLERSWLLRKFSQGHLQSKWNL